MENAAYLKMPREKVEEYTKMFFKKKLATEGSKEKKEEKKEDFSFVDFDASCDKIASSNGMDSDCRKNLEGYTRTKKISKEQKEKIASILFNLLNSKDEDVLSFICRVTCNLEIDEKSNEMELIIKSGIPATFIRFIKSGKESLATAALDALGRVLTDEKEIQRLASENELVQIVGEAMTKYPKNLQIKENAFYLLGSIVFAIPTSKRAELLFGEVNDTLLRAMDYVEDEKFGAIWKEAAWFILSSLEPMTDAKWIASYIEQGLLGTLGVIITKAKAEENEILHEALDLTTTLYRNQKQLVLEKKSELYDGCYNTLTTLSSNPDTLLANKSMELTDLLDGIYDEVPPGSDD